MTSWIVHGLRFACEIVAVAAVVWWGWPFLGILAAVSICVVWGAWVAPKATRRLPDPMRLVVELGIFALAAFALVDVGQTALAAVFAAVALATALLSRRVPAP